MCANIEGRLTTLPHVGLLNQLICVFFISKSLQDYSWNQDFEADFPKKQNTE